MDLQALTPGSLVLTSLLSVGSWPQESEPTPRYDRALAATLEEPDATIRSRARVEILYRAGDLPGALREALGGLQRAPADRILLRRALELETALRMPDPARTHAEELERAVRRDTLDEEARRWWEREAAALSEAAKRMQEHQASLVSATSRAQWVSLGVLGAVLAASIALLGSHPRDGAPSEVERR